ncbi:MAG: hypothetical protein PHG95_00490 [Patescibacteria group bacterium]|nr:hypothetical protein [Patescibacteria group bacterium]
MVLTINTSLGDEIAVSLLAGKKNINAKIKAPRQQAEKLLPLIEKLLYKNKFSWRSIKEIRVQNEGGSFTSLRIGVLTANALAYALGIPAKDLNGGQSFRFSGGQAVKPKYQSEPNIGKKAMPAC